MHLSFIHFHNSALGEAHLKTLPANNFKFLLSNTGVVPYFGS